MFLLRICWRRLGFAKAHNHQCGAVFFLNLIITSVHRPTSIGILFSKFALTPKTCFQVTWMAQILGRQVSPLEAAGSQVFPEKKIGHVGFVRSTNLEGLHVLRTYSNKRMLKLLTQCVEKFEFMALER
jgi:hypothetical protein